MSTQDTSCPLCANTVSEFSTHLNDDHFTTTISDTGLTRNGTHHWEMFALAHLDYPVTKDTLRKETLDAIPLSATRLSTLSDHGLVEKMSTTDPINYRITDDGREYIVALGEPDKTPNLSTAYLSGSQYGSNESVENAQEILSLPQPSKQEILGEIARIGEELNKHPTTAEFDKHANLDRDPVYDYFDSWHDAVQAADIDAVSRKKMLDELHRLQDELGHVPITTHIKNKSRFDPHEYQREFGGIYEAIDEAGLDLQQQITESIAGVIQDYDQRPTLSEIEDEIPYSSTVMYRFHDSLSDAIETARQHLEEQQTTHHETTIESTTQTPMAEYLNDGTIGTETLNELKSTINTCLNNHEFEADISYDIHNDNFAVTLDYEPLLVELNDQLEPPLYAYEDDSQISITNLQSLLESPETTREALRQLSHEVGLHLTQDALVDILNALGIDTPEKDVQRLLDSSTLSTTNLGTIRYNPD